MTNFRSVGAVTRTVFRADLAAAVMAALLVLCPVTFSTAAAAAGTAEALSDGDKTCLGCHADEGLKKNLGNGKSLPLHIAGETYAKSVHSAVGCSACHSEVDLTKHPQTAREIKSAREYSIALTGVCRGCHDETVKRHEDSVHGALSRKGNQSAPICTDCHGPHSVSPNAEHQDACLGCHDGAVTTHALWLPNAARHLRTIACAACHAPTAQPMVELMLYDGVTKTLLTEKEGLQQFEKLTRALDPDDNGLDDPALRKLLQAYNPEGSASKTSLLGRIALRNRVDVHNLSEKLTALRDCGNCHRDRARPFQRVAVSIVGSDGKYVRHEARREVLTSAFSVDSVRGFYAIGGTRIELLDALLLLAVLGGLAVPVMHQIMKRLVTTRLGNGQGTKAPEKPRSQSRQSSVDRPKGDDTSK